jgi:flagella basal body P-ring formation protein FlgA
MHSIGDIARLGLFLLALACLRAFPEARADETGIQSPQTILSAVLAHLESRVQEPEVERRIEVAPLDYRLRLPACSLPLEAFSPPGARAAGALSVGVRCAGDRPWTLYHRAAVHLYKAVAVLKNPAERGHILAPADIALEQKDLSQLRGLYATPQQALGKPLKRALPAGTVLAPQHLAVLMLVKRGQSVNIRADDAGYEVSMTGAALMDGAAGQRIRVRNSQSGRIVEGAVTADGAIAVGR